MDLEAIKGIGPKMANKLKQVGINSPADLIAYYPYAYDNYQITNLSEADSNKVTIRGIINDEPRVSYLKRNLNRLTFKVISDNLLINVSIFNRAFLKNNLHVNQEVNLHGRYDKQKNLFTASNIFINNISDNLIQPRYHLVKGLTSKELNRLVKNLFSTNIIIKSLIPDDLSDKYNFVSQCQAVELIHFPKNTDDIKKAKLRLVYEELFLFMFKINLLKYESNHEKDALNRNVNEDPIIAFINKLPYQLTIDQQTAVTEIYDDLTKNKRMNRLLLGDVGSGKTIVSIIALLINYLGGYQGAMMVPTEILANQQYNELKTHLEPLGINLGLLTGSMTKKEKELILERLVKGEIDILIGTHALISKNVEFANLGLVVTDEQHRFGVNQRGVLQNKGRKCDILYLSATPIPRTYALTIYGDMDTSYIKSKIMGRKDILTKVVKEKELKEVLATMYSELKAGHQVFVVAPLIDENEESSLNDVNKLKEKFEVAFNGKIKIAILHGKMSNKEKEEVMNLVQNNQIQVLISTTVVEVGIDIKNATMMVIFNAERFGLATLHQLRGRVGRNDTQSYCYLICNTELKRLHVMEESNDGFYISEKDFELRGQGDLFGIKQSGDMVFKVANLKADYKILLQAKKDAEQFIKNNINNEFNEWPEYKEIYKNITIY